MSYFFLRRRPQPSSTAEIAREPASGPRIGLTVSRAMGKAVRRNRIKRRFREAVRQHLGLLQAPVEVVLPPGRNAAEVEFSLLERDVAQVFHAIQQDLDRQLRSRGIPAGRGIA